MGCAAMQHVTLSTTLSNCSRKSFTMSSPVTIAIAEPKPSGFVPELNIHMKWTFLLGLSTKREAKSTGQVMLKD